MGLGAFVGLLLGVGGFMSGNYLLGAVLLTAGIVLSWLWIRRTVATVRAEAQATATPPALTIAIDHGRGSGRRWRDGAPPRIHPSQVPALPDRPVGWPILPQLPYVRSAQSEYVAVANREYARTDCPYCGVQLDPLPKAKKRCPQCRSEIFVRSGPDNRRYLMTAGERPAFEAQWQQAQMAEWQARRARAEAAEAEWLRQAEGLGITVGDSGLDVVGESFHLAELVALTKRYPDGLAVALLRREPNNEFDRNAIEVVIDGVPVGHLSREDAEDYQDTLKSFERAGRGLYLIGEMTGGEVDADGMHGPVGVFFEHAPDPE